MIQSTLPFSVKRLEFMEYSYDSIYILARATNKGKALKS